MRVRPTADQPDAGSASAAELAPQPADAVAAQGSPKEDGQRSAGRGSRFALRNWRVSWRLIALIAIPTVTAMAFGLVRIQEAMKSAAADQRVEQMANLGRAVTHLAFAMEDERDGLAGYIASQRAHPVKAATGAPTPTLNADYARTSAAASQVKSLSGGIASDSAVPAQVRDDLSAVLHRISDLPRYRAAAAKSLAPLNIINAYSNAISSLFTLNDQIAQGSTNPTLTSTVRALGALSRTEDETSQQRGILYAALLNRQFDPGTATALINAAAAQRAEFQQFQSAASISEQQTYSKTVAGPAVDAAQAMEAKAISTGGSGGKLAVSLPPGSPKSASVPAAWNDDMSTTLSDIRTVEQGLVNNVIAQSQAQHSALTRTAVETGIEVLAVLIVVLMITIVVARSMVRPLRKLRTGALEIAGLRLPDTVRRMSETDGENVSLEVEPIDVNSSDEIGEVARAFDQVHREALRLAANEAALRGNVNAMFVNLSRRSQSLVERQIRLIDDLEQGEQDPERLSSLFQMDHLATRMRRNSENLLVLAGHDESRRWNQPVALVDVLRAALSEIEQYERVTLNVQPGIAVRGQAVSDVVHLTAELVENATSFSAADTPVTIAGHLLSSGGVLLEITDQGVGMGAEEMAHANWRLDNPPVVDVAVSRRMGLFVVARLAARHGIRVRLRPSASGGLIALVWLPDETIMHETAEGTPGMRGDGAVEPALGPFADGAFAGVGAGTNGGSASIWGDDGRSIAEQEVNAARTPRFAPLRADAEDTSSSLGPKRIPGAGPRPGGWAATGPLPVFRTVPRPAAEDGPELGMTAPQPTVTGPLPFAHGPKALATGPQGPVTEPPPPLTGPPFPAIGSQPPMQRSQPPVTGPQPSVRPDAEPEAAPNAEAAKPDLPAAAAAAPAAFDFGGALVPADSNGGNGSDGLIPVDTNGGNGENGSDSSLTTPYSVLGAPAGLGTVSARDAVVVPPAEGEEHRLPIFEAVESDWFRRGRPAVGRPASEPEPSTTSNGWATSPADEGWRAAEAVSTPASGGVTSAGLPKRVPQANLVPGAAGAAAGSSPATTPSRSAAATRERFASFQRGVREGRAAASQAESDDGEDEGSA